MNDDLKYLIKLQDIDIEIIELENSKKEFPKIVDKLESDIASDNELLKKLEKEISEKKKEKIEIEEKIVNYSLSLENSQVKLNTIKTNKEYDAIHVELESLKQLITTGERQLQKYTDDIKNLEDSLNETLNSFEKKSSENGPQIKELKEKIESIDSVISGVAAKKDDINSKIKNKQNLRAYNYIRASRKKGKVIGFVTNEERNCTICYQVLQPQVVNSIRKAREIIYCQNCGSILIWKDQIRENV